MPCPCNKFLPCFRGGGRRPEGLNPSFFASFFLRKPTSRTVGANRCVCPIPADIKPLTINRQWFGRTRHVGLPLRGDCRTPSALFRVSCFDVSRDRMPGCFLLLYLQFVQCLLVSLGVDSLCFLATHAATLSRCNARPIATKLVYAFVAFRGFTSLC